MYVRRGCHARVNESALVSRSSLLCNYGPYGSRRSTVIAEHPNRSTAVPSVAVMSAPKVVAERIRMLVSFEGFSITA